VDISTLSDTPPWEWPETARETVLSALRDPTAAAADRLTAARLAGENVVMDDDVAEQLLSIVRDPADAADLRARAAISLGPVLEETDMEGFEEDGISDPPISREIFDEIRETLRRIHIDDRQPKEVRRRVLEASVRTPEDWHADAVRSAWSIDDHDWKMTAMFCMGYVPGFDNQIVDTLESPDAELEFEAVRAAGSREVDAAWPHIAHLIESRTKDKDLFVAAIEAAGQIRPESACDLVLELVDSRDEDIAEAARDVLMLADMEDDDLEDEDEEDED
jgi:hypothetical protein